MLEKPGQQPEAFFHWPSSISSASRASRRLTEPKFACHPRRRGPRKLKRGQSRMASGCGPLEHDPNCAVAHRVRRITMTSRSTRAPPEHRHPQGSTPESTLSRRRLAPVPGSGRLNPGRRLLAWPEPAPISPTPARKAAQPTLKPTPGLPWFMDDPRKWHRLPPLRRGRPCLQMETRGARGWIVTQWRRTLLSKTVRFRPPKPAAGGPALPATLSQRERDVTKEVGPTVRALVWELRRSDFDKTVSRFVFYVAAFSTT